MLLWHQEPPADTTTAPGEGGAQRNFHTLKKKMRGVWQHSAMHHPFTGLSSCPPVPATQTSFQLVHKKVIKSVWLHIAHCWKKINWGGNRLIWKIMLQMITSMLSFLCFCTTLKSFPLQTKTIKRRLAGLKKIRQGTFCRGLGSGILVGCIRAYHIREDGMDLVSSQWSGRVDESTEGRQKREERREKEGEKGRMENYLNLPTFHQRAVELFPGFLCVCTVFKCHKAKTLWNTAEKDGASGPRHQGLDGVEKNLLVIDAF